MDPLNVFYVNRSHLLVLDSVTPNTAICSLQHSIRQMVGVKAEDQVLLISGGDSIDPDKCLRDYEGHGTVTNPMFLFQRSSRNERDEMSCSQEINELYHIIDDAIEQAQRLESSADNKAIYLSLPERCRQCGDAAQKSVHMCARLVQEHQLLHQGWLALVSNMDESISRLKRRYARHQTNLEKVRLQQEKAIQLLQDFDVCLDQLRKIILPPSILAHSRGTRDITHFHDISLYDWISSTDPQHSLQELVDQVREQFRNFGQSDSRSTTNMIESVVEQAKNTEYREIKGINKRLTQLDHNLANVDKHYNKICEHKRVIGLTLPHIDALSLQERVSEHRQVMVDVYDTLREMRQMCGLFHKSKTELLSNLRTRLNGWIVQAYEKLHCCHTDMMLFEEKFNGLKQRLDLVRQIKETPVMFATAVCEVIRREAFQKEFLSWQSQHSQKCESFSTEEGQIRSDFSSKLERHFLRVLFPGMFDELPSFYVKTVSKYDQSMPPVSADYVRQLRTNIKDLDQYLLVTSPQIFRRLLVQDPMYPSPSLPHMKREESFFTADSVNNIAVLNKNFPSSTWLSGVDTMDNSPSAVPTLRMGNSPPTDAVSASVNMHVAPSLNQLSMLGEEDENGPLSSSLAKSAPIKIPATTSREVSEKSSQFSTPDDHFMDNVKDDGSGLQQFPVDDLTTRSQSLEFLKPIVLKIVSLSKSLLDIRADLVNDRAKFEKDFEHVATLTQELASKRCADIEEKFKLDIKQRDDEITKLNAKLSETSIVLEERDGELTKLRSDSETRNQEAESELLKLQEEAKLFEGRIKEAESEVFKQLTIEYELQAENQRAEHEEMMEERDKELCRLRKEVEKKNQELEFLKADTASDEFRKLAIAEVRAELEKEFKGKIDLISKGMEQKRDETLSRLKKEIELELKMESLKMATSMKWLTVERDQLQEYLEQSCPEAAEAAVIIKKDIEKKIEEDEKKSILVYSRTVHTQTDQLMASSAFPVLQMQQDALLASQYCEMKESTFQLDPTPTSPCSEDTCISQAPTVNEDGVSVNDQSVQTRIGLRSLEMMVSIQDIIEGSTVLVIWDERHNAYILFSASPYLHFVKESSVRRLGLATPNSPRRNWILGKVAHLDLCLIRKATNRYCLPEGTRVYRVDVEPVMLDVRSRSSNQE